MQNLGDLPSRLMKSSFSKNPFLINCRRVTELFFKVRLHYRLHFFIHRRPRRVIHINAPPRPFLHSQFVLSRQLESPIRSRLPDSNWGPSLYKSVTLPTELRRRDFTLSGCQSPSHFSLRGRPANTRCRCRF